MAKHSLRSFDPNKVAELDSTMWEAYYAHSFFFLAWLLAALFKEQFKVSNVVALRLAYYAGVAAMVFRKTGNTDRTTKYLAKYYRLLGRHALEDFDPTAAAESELEWWLVHRYPSRGSLAKALRDIAAHQEDREPNWEAITKRLEKSYVALSLAVRKDSGK